MHRLVINPGTPQAWEIQLKPGTNLIGRNVTNDFKIEDGSVSGSHCQIVVENGRAVIKDLGSTNGTYINRTRIEEMALEPGQKIQLGSIEILVANEAGALPVATPDANVSLVPATDASAIIIPAAPKVSGLRIAGGAHAPAIRITQAESAPPLLDLPPILPTSVGPSFCKFHSKSYARYLCRKCNRCFCELCVSSRNNGDKIIKTCRSCGVECTSLNVQYGSESKGFFKSLPGAFVYPFKGAGIIILVCATIAFSAMGFVSTGLAIFAKIAFYGFVFLFMQNIIHTTTSDENESLGFPQAGGLFGAAFQLAGTIVASFGLALGLIIARFFDVEIPVEAIIGTVIIGCLYFPMAFLAVAMKDSVLAANPLVVIPSILKIPGPYIVTALLLVAIFGIRQLGNIVSGIAGGVSLSTHDMSALFLSFGVQMIWAFISVYLLTVNMRILGLLYNAKKEELEWF